MLLDLSVLLQVLYVVLDPLIFRIGTDAMALCGDEAVEKEGEGLYIEGTSSQEESLASCLPSHISH